jgi:hypothetical protein
MMADKYLMTDAARDVLAERKRQISAEGWKPDHDDKHVGFQMATAAACYALYSSGFRTAADIWPNTWTPAWFKPTNPRRNLVKAAALILAEIERLDRAGRLLDGREHNAMPGVE